VSSLTRLAWRGSQAILWAVLLGFIVLLGLSRFTAYEVLIVRSGSMEPTLATGGIVIVDRNDHVLRVGDIASFREPDGVVTHRVIGLDDRGYVTGGDANASRDPGTRPQSTVYGSFVFALPLLGYLIYVLEQPAVFVLLLVGTGGFLVWDALRTIFSEFARMRREARFNDAD
jgi:signal peptidase